MVKDLLIPTALLIALACSSGSAGGASDADDAARIVPADLRVTALEGGNGVLEVVALTLRAGMDGAEVYAALKNTGDVPACHAAFSIELFDRAERSVAAGIGGLLAQHFYRLADDSQTIAACVAPGDVSVAAVTDLPSDLAIEDVGYAVYRCPYFALDVAPIDGLAVERVERVTDAGGAVYRGRLVNALDVAVVNPSVSVFPLNRAGRPLGVATATGSLAIPAGGSWTFETGAVLETGADYLAYPAGALAP